MDLIVNDPRAEAFARELAERRNISVSEAVIEALEAKLGKSPVHRRPAQDREQFLAKVREMQADLKALPNREAGIFTKDKIDEMWGHECRDAYPMAIRGH